MKIFRSWIIWNLGRCADSYELHKDLTQNTLDIKDAKEAAKILVGLKESDEKDSFKEKNEWLNESEFLSEVL